MNINNNYEHGMHVIFYSASDADFSGWIIIIEGYLTLTHKCRKINMMRQELINIMIALSGIYSKEDDQIFFEKKEQAEFAKESLEMFVILNGGYKNE